MLLRFRQLAFSILSRRVRLPCGAQPSGSLLAAGERTCGEDASRSAIHSSDELCDELLCHMLECECCLNPAVVSCPVYRDFQALIGMKTSAIVPALYAV